MTKLAFKDSKDGYYECDANEDGSPPSWAESLTPCQIHVNPPLPIEQIIASHQAALEARVQERLDTQAQSMNFDNILSGISNASLSIGEYRQADGASLLLWRARTWKRTAEIRDAFLAAFAKDESTSLPTWEEVEAKLPDYPIV